MIEKMSMKSVLLVLLMGLIGSSGAYGIAFIAAEDSVEDSQDTPVFFDKMERPKVEGTEVKWTPPRYEGQAGALGYSADVFKIPAGMEDRVAFWKDIFTQYSTDQGVLHDSKYINLVYEKVDFSDLVQDMSLSPIQKEKARKERIKQVKKDIESRLLRLHSRTSSEGLEGDDLRYWNLFTNISDENKFKEASLKGRLRFQLGQRDRFMEGIFQSGRHIREMEEIFKREGLPMELTRLPFVESSFNLKARSKVGASGIWQFMRSTAKSYMRMDSSVDERNDPLRATLAAARKLRNNYSMLQSWPLAVTGYNHGPTGVQRLVKKYQTQNLAELTDVRRGRFGFASANFYASFLAAVIVEQEAEKHFGPLKLMPELRGTEIKLHQNVSIRNLLKLFNDEVDRAQMFNPHIRSHVWNGGVLQAKSFVRVPAESAPQAEVELFKRSDRKLSEISVRTESEYVISEGETLGDIASRYQLKLEEIMEINGISDARKIKAKQKILLPVKVADQTRDQ